MLKEKENKIMGITMVLSLLSGVALFLYGMSLMGDSLKKVAGNKLELILYRLTNTPLLFIYDVPRLLHCHAISEVLFSSIFSRYQQYNILFRVF
jgi:hypothetical protein